MVAGIKLKVKSPELKALRTIRDSKKLTSNQRERWFNIITDHPRIDWAVTKIGTKVIDRINIAQAADLGALRICKRLDPFNDSFILLDGSLYLPRNIKHETIVKGDEKIPAIAAASVIAKVIRDRIMLRLHKKYPQYGFNAHKGYATLAHRISVKKYGRSKTHRKSFTIC